MSTLNTVLEEVFNSKLGWILLLICICIFIGIFFGIGISDSVKQRDCNSMKMFRIQDSVYTCNFQTKEMK